MLLIKAWLLPLTIQYLLRSYDRRNKDYQRTFNVEGEGLPCWASIQFIHSLFLCILLSQGEFTIYMESRSYWFGGCSTCLAVQWYSSIISIYHPISANLHSSESIYPIFGQYYIPLRHRTAQRGRSGYTPYTQFSLFQVQTDGWMKLVRWYISWSGAGGKTKLSIIYVIPLPTRPARVSLRYTCRSLSCCPPDPS